MLSVLFILAAAWGSPVVAPHPSASESEYRALLAANPDMVSPVESLLRSRPSQGARETLVERFASVQRTFLQDSPQAARDAFEALLKLAHEEDWSEAEREVFFVSALRRAQLAVDGEDRALWLKSAVTLGHNLKPDPKLFPPPLVDEYKSAAKSAPKKVPQIEGLGTEWSMVLINGIPCSERQCPALADAGVPYRFTYLSDKWQPISVVTELSQINAQIPVRRAWIAGNCKKPVVSQDANRLGEARPFFGMDCENSKIAKKEINFQPLPPTPQALTMFDQPKKGKEFYKSPWLWAGVGTVIAILVVQSQNKKSEKREPTTTYGLQ